MRLKVTEMPVQDGAASPLESLLDRVRTSTEVDRLPGELLDALTRWAGDGVEAVAYVCDGRGRTLLRCARGRAAEQLAAGQARYEQGPGLAALTSGMPVRSADVCRDARWPELAADLTARHVLAPATPVHAIPLAALADRNGALVLVGNPVRALTGSDESALGTLVGLALSTAYRQQTLAEALRSRELIGQAVGIVVERRRVTPAMAFRLLSRASQSTNRKLRDVAADLVDTGIDPCPASLAGPFPTVVGARRR